MRDVLLAVPRPANWRGHWVTPDDPEYDRQRSHYNQLFDRKPAVVARCCGVQDVRTALEAARGHDLEIAVRSGGRGFAGHSSVDGGMLLDLSLMKDVRVDPVRKTAWVRPGATHGDVLAEAQPYGLGAITPLSSHIGFTGTTIFCGIGRLSPRYGFGCDSILSAEIMLADGELVTASPDSHPDLFWAVRGAGDNFGVVVGLECRLHPVPPSVASGIWAWSGDQATEVMRRHSELEADASDDLFSVGQLEVGDSTGGELIVAIAMSHLGDEAATAQAVATIDGFGNNPLLRSVEWMDWVTMHHIYDESWPSSRQYTAGGDYPALDEAMIAQLVAEGEALASAPERPEKTAFMYTSYRGAMLREPDPPSAFRRRPGGNLTIGSINTNPGADAMTEEWADGVVKRFSDAGLFYSGIVPNAASKVDVRAAWGDDYDRLSQIKAKYDPENVFHLNSNITPAGV